MVRIRRNSDGVQDFEEFFLIKVIKSLVLFKKIKVFLEGFIKLSESEAGL